MQFHFLLLHGSVCVKGSHRANNGKQRTRLPGDLPEAWYHNGRAEKRKITNTYKVFFLSELACQRHDALSSNGAVSNSQSTANFSDVTVKPLQSLLNSVGGVESIFSIFGIPDLPISHSLFPYKEHIKQPRLRRYVAKTPQKKCIHAVSN